MLLCYLLVHVDDFLVAYSPHFDFKLLQDAFSWGSMVHSPAEMTFCGRQLKFLPCGSVLIHQRDYTNSTVVRKLSSAQLKRENPGLTKEERAELLSYTHLTLPTNQPPSTFAASVRPHPLYIYIPFLLPC